MELSNKENMFIICIGYILSPIYMVMSALTGAAILSQSYTKYDIKEATIMAAIGVPFIVFLDAINIICKDETESSKTIGALIIGLCSSTVISSLIGFGIYNEFEKTTMGIGQTAASSAVGASILALPIMGVSVCCAAALLYTTENNEENLERPRPLQESLEQFRIVQELTRIMLERDNENTEENNANTVMGVEAVSARDIEPVLTATAVNSIEMPNQAVVSKSENKKGSQKIMDNISSITTNITSDYLKIV